ncbi:HEAT repeat domain-containing protein [Desulfobacterales bacterium HSG2]|nr:HEAT repeat domain-containing protein [Desulfobacterales bacterium HSG2]
METQLDKYITPALWLSAAYSLVACLSWNHIVLLWLTIWLIIFNFSVSLACLFSRGRITSAIIILNLLQLSLFCRLHIQIYEILGAAHYSYASPPCWYDWTELIAVHALRAVDLLDAIEAYGIRLQNVRNQSALSGIALFSMHVMVDIFILGAVFSAIDRRSSAKANRPMTNLAGEFVDFLAMPRSVRRWGLLAATGLMCVAGYVEDCIRGLDIPRNWFFYPLDNILRTLDFGDAFQIFGWRLHSLEMGNGLATLAIYYRLLIASYTIVLANRFYLRLLEGHGKTVEDLAMICVSSEYSMEERMIAVKALAKFGSYPVSVISRLAESLADRKKHRDAAAILSEIGPAAIPHIIKALTHRDESVRRSITDLLNKIDPWWYQSEDARGAVFHLVKSLAYGDSDLRFAIFEVLEEIDPRWPRSEGACSAVPCLIKSLSDDDAGVRIAAADALEIIGPAASRAVFRLVKLLTDNNRTVREAATDALKRIDPRWPESESAYNTIPYLVKALTDMNGNVRIAAIRVLRKIDPQWPRSEGARSAVPYLMKALTDTRKPVRTVVREALKQIDPGGELRVKG